jgi:hypothetical protein
MKGVAIIASAGLTFALAWLVTAAAACTFPDLSYGAAEVDGAAGLSAAEGGDAPSAIPEESGPTDGDGSPPRSDGGEAGDPCDKDNDGFRDVSCSLGLDCCDTDPRAKPTQSGYFATKDACGSFDYDCSGAVEAQYGSLLYCVGESTVACVALCPSSQCTCAGAACGYGFTGPDPGCGNAGAWGTCSSDGSCVAKTTIPELTQQCH